MATFGPIAPVFECPELLYRNCEWYLWDLSGTRTSLLINLNWALELWDAGWNGQWTENDKGNPCYRRNGFKFLPILPFFPVFSSTHSVLVKVNLLWTSHRQELNHPVYRRLVSFPCQIISYLVTRGNPSTVVRGIDIVSLYLDSTFDAVWSIFDRVFPQSNKNTVLGKHIQAWLMARLTNLNRFLHIFPILWKRFYENKIKFLNHSIK